MPAPDGFGQLQPSALPVYVVFDVTLSAIVQTLPAGIDIPVTLTDVEPAASGAPALSVTVGVPHEPPGVATPLASTTPGGRMSVKNSPDTGTDCAAELSTVNVSTA